MSDTRTDSRRMNPTPAMLHPDQSQIHRRTDGLVGNTSHWIGANNATDHSLCKIWHSRSVIRLQLAHEEGQLAYINAHLAISIRGAIRQQRIEHKTCNMVIWGWMAAILYADRLGFRGLVGRAWLLPVPITLGMTARCIGSQRSQLKSLLGHAQPRFSRLSNRPSSKLPQKVAGEDVKHAENSAATDSDNFN